MKPSTKVAKEATIAFAGMGLGDAIRYVFIALLARLVGVKYLGIYSLASSVTRITEVFGKAGLDGGILRFVSRQVGTENKRLIRHDIGSALKMGLIISLLFMIAQILLAGWLASSVFHGVGLLKIAIIVNALSLPFTVTTLIAAYATQAYKILKYKVFVTSILNPAVLLVSMIAVLFLVSAEAAIIVPVLISSVIGLFVMMRFLRNLTGVGFASMVSEGFNTELLKFSYPLMFMTAIGTLMHWMDVMMLGYFMDEKTVGLYFPAARTVALVRTIVAAFIGIFAPMVTELHGQGKYDEMSALFKLVVRWICTLALPVVTLLVVFPSKVILLFGPEYLQASNVMVVLAVAALVQSFFWLGGPTLNMTGYAKLNLLNTSVAAILDIVLNILWIPRYGIMGAAWATLVSIAVLGILMGMEVMYLTKLQPLSLKLVKPFVAGIASYSVLSLAKPYLMPFHTLATLSLAAMITFVSFAGVLWLLKFDSDDREVWNALLMIGKFSKPR